ncbi:MAG: family 65 glycosyl hydrolase domain-containing protein [Crocinitomicaceae bacterium]
MQNLFDIHEWKVIQTKFDTERQEPAESIFSIGNGSFGQRANFEEKYSGKSLQGSYVGGVYYPDKTRVGWWKNGYPEYFAKVLNSCNWIGIYLEYQGVEIDLATVKVKSFYRELDMQKGILIRKARILVENDKELEISSTRFCSMDNEEVAAIKYSITPINFSGNFRFKVFLDNNVNNQDSNYDEFFWEEDSRKVGVKKGVVTAKTKKTGFLVATAMRYSFWQGEKQLDIHPSVVDSELYIENNFEQYLEKGNQYTIKKYVSVASSINHSLFNTTPTAVNNVTQAYLGGFDALYDAHVAAWAKIWRNADVKIDGDVSAQQAIRFNIFHLYQTYTGNNAKLNIGPKGFTGEKYGGATYWDTEAYCIPFYLKTAHPKVARQLLMYRFNQLDRAIENAEKLGFKDGAALYPMVTMNGEECHNEWEITFEEIHRNAAIAFAIYNYTLHTNDENYVKQYGRKVVNGIARFWAQRFNWSEAKQQYVMLGVTGPNEYENNINNNWYTNYAARWCINYALELEAKFGGEEALLTASEQENFEKVANNIFFPKKEGTNVFLQQESFLDKELIPASELPQEERPLNQYWSWDRILRSVYIKQADVLQGIYLFENEFTDAEIKDNYDFYEPFTVHESSLSPCIHSIIASKLKYKDQAYSHYLRTSRLDLDDYNSEVAEGLHITSMAGTWMSIVEGMAGVRIEENALKIEPLIPVNWNSLNFSIFYQNNLLEIKISQKEVTVKNNGNTAVNVLVLGETHAIASNEEVSKAQVVNA